MESRYEGLVPFPVRLSKVFADEACRKIIVEANLREISAPTFHAEFGGDTVEGVRRRFKTMEKVGWLKQVGQKTGGKRRGAKEQFYKATGPAIFDDDGPWANVPDSLTSTGSWTTFERLSKLVKEAMVAGTFDAREDRCLAWSILSLDQQGWEKVTARIEAMLTFVLEEQERAKVRMAESGAKPITMTVALAAFELPMESAKEP